MRRGPDRGPEPAPFPTSVQPPSASPPRGPELWLRERTDRRPRRDGRPKALFLGDPCVGGGELEEERREIPGLFTVMGRRAA